MKEGQKHIRKKNDPNVSYCGANIHLEFALLGIITVNNNLNKITQF